MPLRILKKIGSALLGRKPRQPAHAAKNAGHPSRPAAEGRSAETRAPAAARGAERPPRSNDGRGPSPRPAQPRRERSPSERTPREAGRPAAEKAPARAAPATPWSVDQFQVPPQEGKMRFHDFDLPVEIMHAIADLGFKYCTPIQALSLSQALAGANVAGRAQTGTGKTAAFLIAILTRFLRSPEGRAEKPGTPRALVIAPTRELCVQICRDAEALGRHCGLRSLAVFGGMDYAKQQRQLADGPVDLLVATPGRLLDFQRQRVVDLSRVDTLVIDEADRMLDMGFIPDVRRIVRCLPDRDRRKTLLYSATLTEDVMRLASQWMPNPMVVEAEPEHVAGATITQIVYIVTADEKFTLLCNLLKRHAEERVLIFANRRVSTERLATHLDRQGFHCELLSGDVQQTRRMRVLEDFRSGKVKIVVATDVAGRGLHIADIGLVVNFELPYEPEDYVHRIGRTGRAGNVGTAVSFACEDESFAIPGIESYIGETMKCTMPEEELLQPLPKPARRSGHGEEGGPAPRHEGREPRRDGRDSRGGPRHEGHGGDGRREGGDRGRRGGDGGPRHDRPRHERPAAPAAAPADASKPSDAPAAKPRTPGEDWVPGKS